MKKQINFLGFLSLVSLVAVLGYTTKNTGWYGFLGFLYYLRYFWVIPDELFKENIRRAGSLAFFTEMFALPILLFLFYTMYSEKKAIPHAFGTCFALGIFSFTIFLTYLEWKELQGSQDD